MNFDILSFSFRLVKNAGFPKQSQSGNYRFRLQMATQVLSIVAVGQMEYV